MTSLLKSFLAFIFALVFFFLTASAQDAHAVELNDYSFLIWEQNESPSDLNNAHKVFGYAMNQEGMAVLFMVANEPNGGSSAIVKWMIL